MAAEPVAAAADALPEEPDAAAGPDAVAADALLEEPGAAAGRPLEGVAAPVLLSAASDAAAAAEVKPGVGVQRGRPAAKALQARLRVSPMEKLPLVFASLQAFSGHPRLRHQTPAPLAPRRAWSQICFQG